MAYTTIDDPTIFFNTVLYTGDASSPKTISGVGFQPDWNWSKSRSSSSYDHLLTDSVRGTSAYYLKSNSNVAETSNPAAGYLSSFNSDGYVLTAGGSNNTNYNANSVTYVSWNWKAGGSASSNGDGDITSSVSANTTAGFSIVSYTGNGSATQTIGHGLGAVPKVMIFKRRNSTSDWIVYHVTRGATKYIALNGTSTGSTYEPYFANTEPTSSVFTVDTAGDINGSSDTFIAYLFSEIKGYSKFSSYIGNGSSDGPFIYTGFRPAWVLYKNTTTADSWFIHDNRRQGFNDDNEYLFADLAQTEGTINRLRILSNGFKPIDSDKGVNKSGDTYIYLAFAESPLVNSNGVPTNAR